MDYDLPEYLRQPSPYRQERLAAKKEARRAFLRDLLSAGIMIVALVLTITLAVISAIPTPPDAHAEEIAPVAPQNTPSAPEAPRKAPAPAPVPGNHVYAVVTAYSSSPDETDDTPFITADGSHVTRGTLACPVKYPFGTQVRIEGEIYTCSDRMNPRYQHTERFDIWMPTKADALAHGTQQLTVEIL